MKIVLTSDMLYVDSRAVIDAKKKISERNPKGWIDPQAFNELGDVWEALKKAYINNKNVEETLKEFVIKKFGVEREVVETVEIEGGIPEHWKEMKEGKIKFR
ncbi:MAG: hypothetical protein HYW89_00205 [Candidatus Sungiibacteriota bacterium]|uniref:Uncharacterized protein n=1 Tax=Candidatus Sungiibacteriota bacterium TaxID=2750080 RepID=A0A7T5URC2_9BACT|nr:MAG: hypothetical protein HYW89_00205 [Candidatus Sungbacteria bacterium]